MLKNSLLLLIPLLFSIAASSQKISSQVFASGGKHVQNSYAQVSFTFGEPFTNTINNNTSTVLTQGFHQTNLTISSIDEVNNLFSFNYYPIPVTANLMVESANYSKEAIINIYDANAKLVASQVFVNNKSEFDLSQIASGNYFVTIKNNEDQLLSKRTISVIK